MRKSQYNDSWLYKKYEYSDRALALPVGDLNHFEQITLPHDALISNTDCFYRDCVIWYARPFGIKKEAGKRYILYFEGAYMDMALYVNQQQAGQGVNGYTSCFFDLTELVKDETDRLYVRIQYQNPNARWYAGPGINRRVWMYVVPDTHIVPDSLAIGTVKKESGWEIQAAVEIRKLVENDDVVFTLYDGEGRETESVFCLTGRKEHQETACLQGVTVLSEANLWSTDFPYLYRLKVAVKRENQVVDEVDTAFGCRELSMDGGKGLLINGVQTKLKGVCLHADSGALGSQFHRDIAYRQIKLMKDMGANAIRTAHNAVAPEFLELCDELGMLVCNEIFDCWKRPKNKYDYARFFEEHGITDVTAWVRRDRNHPSVIMWSVGNEIYDTHVSCEGRETLKQLTACVQENDLYEHARVTIGSNYIAWDQTKQCADDIKLMGYNYSEKFYESHHKEHPDWILYGSETASCVQSRGIYHFPLSQSLLVDDDEQCSSLGNSSTSWGAKTHDCCLVTQRDVDYVMGQFVWAGIDYLGEPTPYHTKNSYFGLADTACFPKDAYFLYQSVWTDCKEAPMVHLLPYWDFNPGQKIDVRIVSNADKVELFQDHVSQGCKVIDHKQGNCFYADYQLPYSPGILEAKAYDKTGRVIATDRQESFGDAAGLRLSEETFEAKEKEDRIFFTTISAVDAKERPVRNANDRVRVMVEGPGRLVGLDNGDSTDYDSYQAPSRRMFSGLLLAMIRTTGAAGKITVRAVLDPQDIPVRKVEIISRDTTTFTPEKQTLQFEAVSYPKDANPHRIRWQITNDAAIPVKNAVIDSISEDGRQITVSARADGRIRLRALAEEVGGKKEISEEEKAGGDGEVSGKVGLISSLELTISGLGDLYLNPYEFISGSLYTKSCGETGNGNEKGVSTSRHGMTWMAYENIDFGAYRSHLVTIPIFELDNQETELIFWKGIPYKEGSSICGRGIYHKQSIWNTYQEQTFMLETGLTGQETFGIELHHKVHIKGFLFEKENPAFQPAFEKIEAIKAAKIYGDSFTRQENALTDIGNNVSLVFEQLDFGEAGTHEISICGRTSLDNNSIHILFEKDGEVTRQILEFTNAEEYVERTFSISPVQGTVNVTLLFLPGSRFDFMWMRFRQSL